MNPSEAQIRVTFVTTHTDLELPEAKRHLLVPADIKRYGLSQILNSETMLDSARPVPLEFLVNGASFLPSGTTLADHLASEGLSPETTVVLHYVPSLLPPVYQASFEHDDWVCDVDVLSSAPANKHAALVGAVGEDRLLSASYDRLLRIWDASGQLLATSPNAANGGHARRVNTAKFVSPFRVASAGLDGIVLVWQYGEKDDDRSAGRLKPVLQLHGHQKMINTIDVHAPSKRILTASADGTVGLWSTSKEHAPAYADEAAPTDSSAKRAKLSAQSTTPARGALAMIPVSTNDAVSSAIFHPTDATVAYAASRDHALRTLDLTTGRTVATLTTLHPLLCLANVGPSHALVAAGTSARHVTLFDPRQDAAGSGANASASASALTLRGHTNWVTSISASPEQEHALVSASWDGTCRVWDLRDTRTATAELLQSDGLTGSVVREPTFTIPREHQKKAKSGADAAAGSGVKVLAVQWDGHWGIVSGGEDKKVQINKTATLGGAEE